MRSLDIPFDSELITQLNTIAAAKDPETGLPPEVSDAQVNALCEDIKTQLADRIDRLATETLFTQREAEAWAVSHIVDANHRGLTPEAIVLYLATMTDDRDVTIATTDALLRAADEKYDQAYATVKAATAPAQSHLPPNPTIVWLAGHDVTRLRERSQSDEQTVRAVVDRLLDQTQTTIPLEELIARYCETKQPLYIGVQTKSVRQEINRLVITASNPTRAELGAAPALSNDIDGITIDGESYNVQIIESPTLPQDYKNITIFAADSLQEVPAVSIEEGIATLKHRLAEVELPLEELVEQSFADCSATRVRIEPSLIDGDWFCRIIIDAPDSITENPEEPNVNGRFRHVSKVVIDGTSYSARVYLSAHTKRRPGDDLMTLVTADGEQSLAEGLEQVRSHLQTQSGE